MREKKNGAKVGSTYLKHLFVCDEPISVNVIELEGPFELLVEVTSAGDAQCGDEFPEVNGAALVIIEDVEYIVGECGWIPEAINFVWMSWIRYNACPVEQ